MEKRKQELEEQRLADLRAQGTAVTLETFAEWKRKFDAETRLQKLQLAPETAIKDKGPSGKVFFQSQDAATIAQVIY